MTHKILTIDDHADTLNAVVDTLEQYGYQVLSSQSPFRGLEIAAAEQPDLILLDVNMPGMDGNTFARRLRANDQLAYIPIIMFTAESLPEQKLAGFDAGADDYLLKPTDPDVLIARIQAIVGPAQPAAVVAAQQTPSKADSPTTTPHNKTIALLGAHGGAGTTILALNLALAIAESGVPTTLIDYDLTQGHIALYLNQKELSHSLNQYARQPAAAENVYKNLIDHSDNLRLLLAEPNPLGAAPLPDNGHSATLLQTLSERDGCVILDLGRGLNAITQPLMEQVDEIYVCVQPNRVGLASARYLLHKLEKELVSNVYLAAISFHIGSSTIPLDPIAQYLKRPVLAMVTVHPKEMTTSINQMIPLIHMAQSPAGETIRLMARKIMAR
ncbi:MAG: response regulator [Chloroflexota bacterium]